MTHCQRYLPPASSRREFLARTSCGFGGVAFAALASENLPAAPAFDPGSLAPRTGMFPAKARNVIFLYMDGG